MAFTAAPAAPPEAQPVSAVALESCAASSRALDASRLSRASRIDARWSRSAAVSSSRPAAAAAGTPLLSGAAAAAAENIARSTIARDLWTSRCRATVHASLAASLSA